MDRAILFTPLSLKHITLPGRLVRSATEFFGSEPDGHVAVFEYDAFRQLGEQPLGMILTSHTCVSPEGRSNPWQNAVWDDSFLPDTERLAREGGKNGVPVVLQIGHGGMKAKGNNGGLPVYTPDTMTEEEIRGVVRAFGEAALRAKTAGMSGVMLHVAHLYLLSQFFYPKFNHRTDRYGGCAANRFRIVMEALEAVKKTCGDDYPVFFKINGDDEGQTEAYHADLVEVLREAEDGFDAAEISGWDSAPLGRAEKPYFIDNIRRLKDEVGIPLIEVGGMRSAKGMLDAFEAGACAVSVSRPLFCEPDFAEKIRDKDLHVSPCRGCGYCFGPFDRPSGVRCPVAGKVYKMDL